MDISGGDPPSNIQERFEKLEELSQGMERMFHQINEGTSRDLADLKHASEAGVQLARDESRADRKALQEQMDTRFTDLTGNCRTLETAVNDNAAGVARDIAALQAGVVTVQGGRVGTPSFARNGSQKKRFFFFSPAQTAFVSGV